MRFLRITLFTTVCALATAASVPRLMAIQSVPNGAASDPLAVHQAVINKYCVGCHNDRSAKTGGLPDLALNKLDLAKIGDAAPTWEKVVNKLRAGTMPPVGRPRPDGVAYD